MIIHSIKKSQMKENNMIFSQKKGMKSKHKSLNMIKHVLNIGMVNFKLFHFSLHHPRGINSQTFTTQTHPDNTCLRHEPQIKQCLSQDRRWRSSISHDVAWLSVAKDMLVLDRDDEGRLPSSTEHAPPLLEAQWSATHVCSGWSRI